LKVQNKDYSRKPGIKYTRFAGYQDLEEEEKAIAQKVIDTIDRFAATCNMPFDTVFRKTDVVEVVKNPSYLARIKFPSRISESSVQGITCELQSILKVSNNRAFC